MTYTCLPATGQGKQPPRPACAANSASRFAPWSADCRLPEEHRRCPRRRRTESPTDERSNHDKIERMAARTRITGSGTGYRRGGRRRGEYRPARRAQGLAAIQPRRRKSALLRGLRPPRHPVAVGLPRHHRPLHPRHARAELRPLRNLPRVHLQLHRLGPLPDDGRVLPRDVRPAQAVHRRRALVRLWLLGGRGRRQRALRRSGHPPGALRQPLLQTRVRQGEPRLHAARLLWISCIHAVDLGPLRPAGLLHPEADLGFGRRHPLPHRRLGRSGRGLGDRGAGSGILRRRHRGPRRPQRRLARPHRAQRRTLRRLHRLPLLRRRRRRRRAPRKGRQKLRRQHRQPRQQIPRRTRRLRPDVPRHHPRPTRPPAPLQRRHAADRALGRHPHQPGLHEALEPHGRATGRRGRARRGRLLVAGRDGLPARSAGALLGPAARQPDARHPPRHEHSRRLHLVVERRNCGNERLRPGADRRVGRG